jgi:hypothetical protein
MNGAARLAGKDRPLVVLLLNPATTTAGPGKSYGCEAVRGEGGVGGVGILVIGGTGSERVKAQEVSHGYTSLKH